MLSASAAIVALVLSMLVNRWLLASSRPTLMDHPNDRSLHEVAVPRGGGLGIVLGTLTGGAMLAVWHPSPLLVWLGAAALLVAGVSFLDDLRGLSPLPRFVAHALAALLLIGAGLAPVSLRLPGVELAMPVSLGALFAFLLVVWLVNLYNFMDGMDGFAAGMGVAGFGTYALLAHAAGVEPLAGIALCACLASAGFGWFNFPPARVFMGDVGASFLGLLAAALALWAEAVGAFPLWIAALVFSPFIVDATVTLARRLVRGERVWQAHRSHYYQRLVGCGWTHKRTVLCEYSIMALVAVSALLANHLNVTGQWLVIIGWGLAYTSGALLVARLERTRRC